MSRMVTFEEAKARYVHRFTMEHVPSWAGKPMDGGRFYAPQFSTDREWYDKATFPGEAGHVGGRNHCFSIGQTWPLGKSLKEPFKMAGPGPCPTCPHGKGFNCPTCWSHP